ncbi:MAG: hypothetical protein E3J94_02660 [Desulfobacteraceae bacterium]|nr:MAG: hypothetical protein E3J94_02660 [Desulfobacteraceae bacterium]
MFLSGNWTNNGTFTPGTDSTVTCTPICCANAIVTTANGVLIFNIFAALAQFERDLIRERTLAGH